MKNFAKLLILILCFSAQCALANPLVGVLALDNREVPQYTYIFQNSSSLISGDIVNAFRNDGTFAVKYIDTKTLNQNDFAVVYNNYKYAGIIDLDKINSLNKKIGANYILLLTGEQGPEEHPESGTRSKNCSVKNKLITRHMKPNMKIMQPSLPKRSPSNLCRWCILWLWVEMERSMKC